MEIVFALSTVLVPNERAIQWVEVFPWGKEVGA
jgi:hypothetical protein